MNDLTIIKNKISYLYKNNPNIHMDVSMSAPKISLKNVKATITNVYPNIFQISENSDGTTKKHIIQYVDLLTNNVKILELH